MTNVRLAVDALSIAPRVSGPATGDIVLMLGSVAFPVAGWNDFVVVILEAWVSALLRLVRGTSEAERVHFMEGPYAVDFVRLHSGAIRVRAIERPNRQHAVADGPPLSLVENAVAVADEVLGVCREKGHRTTDVERLEAATVALRAELAKLTH